MSKQQQPRGRILVVEDQGIVAIDIKRCLEDAGFEVTAIATSMEDAIREASQSRPDLVLMDIRIQGVADGIEAADQLHQRFRLPIIYLTAHDDADTLARAKRTEPMAFLLKPFKPAELTSTVEIALNRVWTEQNVLERERSFLSAMGSIGDAVLTADAQGLVRFMNRAAEEMTGWTQASALGHRATEVLGSVEGQRGGFQGLSELLASDTDPAGCDLDNERLVLSRDGQQRWVILKTTRIAGTGGSIRVIVMQDITRRKQNEQAQRRQADLLEQAQEPIFTRDIGGAITYWNRAAQALYGFSSSETAGRAAYTSVETFGRFADETIETALLRDGRWSGELRRITKDGREITVESRQVVVEDEAGRRTVLGTERDITERKGAELEIRRLNQELQQRVRELVEANHELESFNYSVSHDLRAPLRHIDAYSKILLKEHGLQATEDARACLGRICSAARRMGRMVDELLELSRTMRREASKQPTELSSLVRGVVEELKPEVNERDIEWRIGELPFADCDPTLTRQVFANLISNAVKFTRLRKLAVIEVGQTKSDGQTVLFVRDNGVGFSMKYADKLFGVFQRLHRVEDFEGTGVGLATVQRIVQKHGGRIWAEAELDRGATFYFTLAAPGQVSSSRPVEAEPAAAFLGER